MQNILQCLNCTVTHSLSVNRIFEFSASFCCFPFKYLTRDRMYDRCTPLTLLFMCMRAVVALVGVSMHLGWATWWVTVRRWRFKWGGRGTWQGWLLLPSALPGSPVAALSLTDPQCLSSESTEYPWIPQPELNGITHKGRVTQHYIFTVSLREY